MTIPLIGRLYIQRPGQRDWTVLVEYPYLSEPGIPDRIVPAGPDRVVTYAGVGHTELVTIGPGNTVTRHSVSGAVAVDPITGTGVRIVDGMIRTVNLVSGTESDFAPVPTEVPWDGATSISLSINGSAVAVTQLSQTGAIRLVAVGPDGTVIGTSSLQEIPSAISMAPDGRTVVAQTGHDLYRYEMQ